MTRDLDPRVSPSATRLALIVGIPLAIVLGVPAASRAAATLTTWSSGDTLTAADLNANFAALNDAVARLDPVTVAADGAVGIGTTTPLERLHVEGKIVADPTHAAATSTTQFATTSTTFVDVPGLTVTVTTHGKPVMLTVNTNFNPTTGGLPGGYGPWGLFTLTRNNANLGHALYGMQIVSAAINDNIPVSFTFVDVPPAGTHTYRLAVRAGEAGVDLVVGEAGVTQQLTATELN